MASLPPYRFGARCLDPPDAKAKLLPTLTSSRNGIYRLGVFEGSRPEFTVLLSLDEEGA